MHGQHEIIGVELPRLFKGSPSLIRVAPRQRDLRRFNPERQPVGIAS